MITLDDKYKIGDFGLRAYLPHEHQMTPNMERKTLAIPGRAGLWDYGTEIRERPFNINFELREYNRGDRQRMLNKFVAFLHDDFGKPRSIKIIFDYEPDKFYHVKLATQITPERLVLADKFTLPFVAYDPYKYSNVYADEVTWGSEVITFEYHYLLGHQGLGGTIKMNAPQTLDISVDGLAVQPIFEFQGTANNLKIECGNYNFTLPNFTNTKWVIDFEKYLVWRNGEETMIEIRDFYLMPGNNKVQITGSNINIDMRIKFRDKYN